MKRPLKNTASVLLATALTALAIFSTVTFTDALVGTATTNTVAAASTTNGVTTASNASGTLQYCPRTGCSATSCHATAGR
jgi:hypothetical protein